MGDEEEQRITLTAEQAKACEEGGGCLVIPRAVLLKFVEQMKARGRCGMFDT